jgi:hypothetical protein
MFVFIFSFVVTIEMFLQNIKQACDIYGKIKKIIIIGGPEAPGRV